MTIVLNGTTGIANDGGYSGDGIIFADTTPANTLVTTTGGNVGIGTSSPSTFTGYTTVSVNNAANGGIYNILVNGAETARLQGYSGIFNVAAKGASTALTFETNGTERGRFDTSGYFLVGTTSLVGGDGAKMSVSGNACIATNTATTGLSAAIGFHNPNGRIGYIGVNGTTTSYVTSSDYRLKNTIAPMTGALAKVAALKPCTYKWNVDGSDGQGFIAHELAEVVPYAVTGKKDAVDADGNPQYQGIDTSFLVATLTAAIQEQQAIITALTARVTALEGA